MDFIIKTKRLLLRPFEEEDAKALNRIANEKNIVKWMPDWETSLDTTKRRIQYFISNYPLARKDEARVMFALTLDGDLIGMVGIGNKKEVGNEIEVAYFISKAFEGNGYVTEAVKAASAWALETLGLDYLIAIVETDNYPSQRIVEKCGFEKIGTRLLLNEGETEEKPFYYYRFYGS